MAFPQWLMVGCALGLGLYIWFRVRQGWEPTLQHVMESGTYGAVIVAGFDLMWCACLNPGHLVRLVDFRGARVPHVAQVDGAKFEYVKCVEDAIRDGEIIDARRCEIEMGDLHRVHIFACGAGTAYLGFIALMSACRRSSPANQRSEPQRDHGRKPPWI
jgi:hypothetical protein